LADKSEHLRQWLTLPQSALSNAKALKSKNSHYSSHLTKVFFRSKRIAIVFFGELSALRALCGEKKAASILPQSTQSNAKDYEEYACSIQVTSQRSFSEVQDWANYK